MEKIENPPIANYLMGSMRSMGYSFKDAVSDVMDNSISAKCSQIKLLFTKDPKDLYVGILDDGIGMSDEELFHAMCYGSKASEAERDTYDLGRFGLGMKSASLSQCKKMTVVSRKDGIVSAYRWDYDEVSKKNNHGRWYVLKLSKEEIDALYCIEEFNAFEHGTLVLWEDFDVIYKASGGRVYEALTRYRDNLAEHIGLIYHRFMNEDKIKIVINNGKVKPLDPFLEKRSLQTSDTLRECLKDSSGKDHIIEITPYKLPFITTMSDEEQKLIGGAERMSQMQGYYIYRGKRLIKYGTWFGTPRHEVSKYGRVKVDIPNCMDDIWNVDVMKRNAEIPRQLSQLLEKTIGDLIDKSTKQTQYRGRAVTSDKDKEIYVWNRYESRKGFFSYKINRDNVFLRSVISQIPDQQKTLLELLLKEIEQNIPIHQIHLDHDVNKIDHEESPDLQNDLYEQAIMSIEWLHTIGQDYSAAVDSVLKSEQFRNNDKLKNKLYKKYSL